MASKEGRAACVEMFSTRLLRKAYRPDRRHGECPEDVYLCETEFRELVAIAEGQQPMDRGVWHLVCNEFSDRWEHVCHWVHPSRLADVLAEHLGLEWVGEYPPRPDAAQRAKIKSNIKAQRFRCPECGVVCNSYSQYVIHSQGTKHAEALQQRVKAEASEGRSYTSPGAIPLDSDDTVPGVANHPQAYFKRERIGDGLKDSSDESSTGTATPKASPLQPAPEKQRQRNAVPARMAAITAFLAFSVPIDNLRPRQHDPYSFDGGYRTAPQYKTQQQSHQSQHETHSNTNAGGRPFPGYNNQYYYNEYNTEQCGEEIYSEYSGYNYDGGYYDYDYQGYYEEPSFHSGGRQSWWREQSEYATSYVESGQSQVSNTEEEIVDDDEEEEEEEEGDHNKPTHKRRLSYGGLARAWTTPEDAEHEYFTDSESVASSRIGQRRNSLHGMPLHRTVSDVVSIKTSHSSQDFEAAASTVASSEADTVRSMESKVDTLVQDLEHATVGDSKEGQCGAMLAGQEPEVVSEAVLRACVYGNAFTAGHETKRAEKVAQLIGTLQDSVEVAQHLEEDLSGLLEASPAVTALTEDMDAVEASFVDEKNDRALAKYVEVFCLTAHLFALGLVAANSFNNHFAAFLTGMTRVDLLSGYASPAVSSFTAARLPEIFSMLKAKDLLSDVSLPSNLVKQGRLPKRLQKALVAAVAVH